jgi:nitrogen-specific signal transduction histidine kinase
MYQESKDQIDLIVFGEKVPAGTVTNLTKTIRSMNQTIPVFVFTKQSESRLSRAHQMAGVDDLLNIADFDTPLFSWTFTSTLEQAVLKKKAAQYDILQERLLSANDALRHIMHEINNPLSVIRLALYHLDKPDLAKNKQKTFMKLLIDNLEKIDMQMKDLHVIRRQLSGEKLPRAKMFSRKLLLSSV